MKESRGGGKIRKKERERERKRKKKKEREKEERKGKRKKKKERQPAGKEIAITKKPDIQHHAGETPLLA